MALCQGGGWAPQLLLLAGATLAGSQRGFCPRTEIFCDTYPPTSADDPGSGACIRLATSECGSGASIEFVDQSGGAIAAPIVVEAGRTSVEACRLIAEVNTTGLHLAEIPLEELTAALGDGGGDDVGGDLGGLAAIAAIAQTAEDVVQLLGAIPNSELCLYMSDTHLTNDWQHGCLVISLGIRGSEPLFTADAGCIEAGLGCRTATSCEECTALATTLRGTGNYSGSGSCGWCAATGTCAAAGAVAPVCSSCASSSLGEGGWATAAATCPAAQRLAGRSAESEAAESALASGTGLWLGLACGLLLGFLVGGCCAGPETTLGQALRLAGHRLCPDCVPDPYRQQRNRSGGESAGGRVGAETFTGLVEPARTTTLNSVPASAGYLVPAPQAAASSAVPVEGRVVGSPDAKAAWDQGGGAAPAAGGAEGRSA